MQYWLELKTWNIIHCEHKILWICHKFACNPNPKCEVNLDHYALDFIALNEASLHNSPEKEGELEKEEYGNNTLCPNGRLCLVCERIRWDFLSLLGHISRCHNCSVKPNAASSSSSCCCCCSTSVCSRCPSARARLTQSSLLRVSEWVTREGGTEERAVCGNGCSKNRGIFGLRRELDGGEYEDLSVL